MRNFEATSEQRLDRMLRLTIEALLLMIVLVSPWPFGSVEPVAILWLTIPFAIALVLWAVRLLLCGSGIPAIDGVMICLGGMVLLGAVQLLPLPHSLLGILSPNTQEYWTAFLPDSMERVAGEDERAVTRPEHTLTLTPEESRSTLIHLVGLFALYVMVRGSVTTRASFFRLAWLLVVNGTLLSCLAIAQSVSAEKNRIFWSFPVTGSAFGPFVCRNHFPDYVTICVGMSLALLAISFRTDKGILQQPVILWLGGALAVMVLAIFFSMSRGGVFSLLSVFILLAIGLARSLGNHSWIGPVIGSLVLVGLLGSMLGWIPVEERLGTLKDAETLREGRPEIWRDSLRLIPQFPVFGTGNGSYEQVELTVRTAVGEENVLTDHAHNEYLEALVEGGFLRLVLTLGLLFFVIRGGLRYAGLRKGRSVAILTYGGLFGIIALAIHSFFDFGVHIPAIAILAVYMLAALAGVRDSAEPEHAYPLGIRMAVAVAICLLAGLLGWNAWCDDRATRYRNAAFMLIPASDTRSQQLRVEYMRAAVQYRPLRADFHHELATACVDAAKTVHGDAARKLEREAALHWRTARNLAPLRGNTQARIGQNRNYYEQADPCESYFTRAIRSCPTNPNYWYARGKDRLDRRALTEAWSDWQEALRLSDRFLPLIVVTAKQHIQDREIIYLILPPSGVLVYSAAETLYPTTNGSNPSRSIYLDRARQLLTDKQEARTAQEARTLARIYLELGEVDRAINLYAECVRKDGRQVTWRMEYAETLHDAERLDDAERELKWVLTVQSGHARARELLAIIERERQLQR